MCVFGWRVGGDRHRGSDMGGCGAPLAPMASVQVSVRIQGVDGGRVRETGVGRTCHCLALCEVTQRVLV